MVAPRITLLGCCVNASWVAVPGLTVSVADPLIEPEVAVIDWLPAVSSVALNVLLPPSLLEKV